MREAVFDGKLIQDIAHNLNAEILRDFVELWKLIHTLHLDQSCEQEDTIVWTLESSGEYSAKSAYEIQFCGQTFSNFPKLIWKAWATPRIKFFLWLLLQDRVWTATRLQLRGWENNYFCALCERNLETAVHLFTECPFAREVWTMVATWSSCLNLQPEGWNDYSDMEEWFFAITSIGTKAAHSLAMLTTWHIWKERNAIVFQQNHSTVQALFAKIKDEYSNWASAGGRTFHFLRIGMNSMSN